MHDHHQLAIDDVTRRMQGDPTVLALLLGGSISHGYARPDSDVDILIVVDDEEYQRRQAAKELLYFSREACTWPDGYVDGKYLSLGYLRLVAERGNEPTRYAFKDARLLFARQGGIEDLVGRAAVYPEADRELNCQRFYAQVHAWKWYAYEAEKHGNRFLLGTAASNFCLYAGRLVLAHNRRLYPYLKWLHREIARAEKLPAGFLSQLDALAASPSAAAMEPIVEGLKALHDWGLGDWDWPSWFAKDIETTWLHQAPFVADI